MLPWSHAKLPPGNTTEGRELQLQPLTEGRELQLQPFSDRNSNDDSDSASPHRNAAGFLPLSPSPSPKGESNMVLLQTTSATPDLLEALRAIPQHEKVYYSHALRVAPHVAELESDPVAFLRFCDWDATAAARRLTVYWNKRVEIFGEARAFLPLNDFSGNGALGSEEIEILRSGAYCLLPNDSHDRPVCYIDRSRIPPALLHNTSVKVRVMFSVLQKMVPNPVAQKLGGVWVIRGLQTSDSDNIAKHGIELLRDAFPLRVAVFHIVYVREERNGFLQSVVPFLLAHCGQFFSDKILVHDFVSVEQLVQKMARHGISRKSLPRTMGGFADTDGTASSSLYPSMPIVNVPQAGGSGSAAENQQWQPPPQTRQLLHQQRQQQQQVTTSPAANAVKYGSPRRDADNGSLNSTPRKKSPNLGPLRATASPQQHRGASKGDAPFFSSVASIVESPKMLEQSHAALKEPSSGVTVGDRLDNDFLISENITDLAAFDLEGSPFDPAPLAPPQTRRQHQEQQQVATSPVVRAAKHGPPLHDADTGFLNSTPPKKSRFDSSPCPAEASPQQQQVVVHDSAVPATGNEHTTLLSSEASIVESPNMLEHGHAALKEALNELPVDDRAAYEEAARKAPHVLQTDSDPMSYFRMELFNARAAARRLALYWKYRVEYFADRAFLPLTQTSDGALWEEDRNTLSSGYYFFLPADSRGRPVLCCDPSKRPMHMSKASCVRVALYFFSVLWCENHVALAKGCVILVFVSSRVADVYKVDENIREATEIALDSFPIKNCETHVIYSPSPTGSPLPDFSKYVLPLVQRAFGRLLSLGWTQFHAGETRDELGRRLALCGLKGSCLQAAVEGGISDHHFAQWMKNRQLAELQRCAHLLYRHQQQPPSIPPTAPAGVGTSEGTISGPALGPLGGSPSATAQQEISTAMQLVSATDKEAYVEAMRKVPELVMKESDPVRFLKSEKHDALSAARRIATYWRIRREIFSDRSLLPMNQTPDGALDKKDLAVLQTGFLVQLPNDSSTGCGVICYDGALLEKKSSHSSQLRVFFYLWSLVSQNDLSQTDGYSVLFTMSQPSFDRNCIECLNLAMEAHPARLKCFHLLGCCPGDTSENDFRQGPVRQMLSQLDPLVQGKTVVHLCGSRAGFAVKLGHHGMSKCGLPRTLGGQWGLDHFEQWQELRMRFEWQLPIRISAQKVAESYSIPESTVLPPASLDDDEKAERLRRANLIHSRRKRYRARIQVQVLQEQRDTLTLERQQLIQEGRELEDLLEKARSIVKKNRVGGT